MKLAAAIAALLVAGSPTSAQEAGDWVVGIALGTGERAGLFVRYYPVADAGAEVHLLLVPIFDLTSIGAGAGLVAHPLQDERVSVYLGGSLVASQYAGGGADRLGVSLGLGYEPFRDADGGLFGRASLSLARRRAFGAEASRSEVEEGVWGSWRLWPGGQVGFSRVTGLGDMEGDLGAGGS